MKTNNQIQERIKHLIKHKDNATNSKIKDAYIYEIRALRWVMEQ